MKPIQKKESYQDNLNRSYASSWRMSFDVIIKKLVTTIGNLKDRLKDNEQFNNTDLVTLRQLYSKVTKLVEKNKQENNSDIAEEIGLVQQMLDIINLYGPQTNIYAGIQKRINKTWAGSAVSTVTSYYYHVGKDESLKALKLY